MQEQVRSLVGGEATRKAERQRGGVEQMPRTVRCLGRRAGSSQVPGQSFASVFDEGQTGSVAEPPETGVGYAANVLLQRLRRTPPPVLAAGLRPKLVGF